MAQLVRAPPCHGGGRRFESDLGRLSERSGSKKCGGLAQLGEHLPYKQGVTGSSPVASTFFKKYFENHMGDFPSGQREQTVNLLALPSVVRIHDRPVGLTPVLTRGGAVWKLVGLITRRSQVQILSPLFENIISAVIIWACPGSQSRGKPR